MHTERNFTAFLYTVALLATAFLVAEFAKRGIDHLAAKYDIVPQPPQKPE
jgi:hypothetical protein